MRLTSRVWPAALLAGVVVATTVASSTRASADRGGGLTRERVIELARTASPSVRVSRTAIEEERASLVGARIFARDNPVFEAVAGPRWDGDTALDFEATLAIPFELGGKRRKRVAAAQAGVERATAQVAVDAQEAVAQALAAYYTALHAEERLRLAEDRKRLADQLLDGAKIRHDAGDVAELEVNLAATEVARAESEVLAEVAEVQRARGDVATVLGLAGPDAADVGGVLGDRSAFDTLRPEHAQERADIIAARETVDEERAEIASADTSRLPDLNLRVTYAREDGGTQIVLAGLAVTLPWFDRGQGERAGARARTRRAELQLGLTTQSIDTEREVALRAYRTSVAAVVKLETDALPLVDRNEQLAAAAYQAGKADISTVILVRRESLDTRREHLDRQLAAALAGVGLSRALGAL